MTKEEAIKWFKENPFYNENHKPFLMAIEALQDRPTGEWMEMGTNADGTHNIKCDQCGEGFKTRGHARSHNTKNKYKFCPNCGAKMERKEDGN